MYENLIRCDASWQQGLASIISCEISSILSSGQFWKKLHLYFAGRGFYKVAVIIYVSDRFHTKLITKITLSGVYKNMKISQIARLEYHNIFSLVHTWFAQYFYADSMQVHGFIYTFLILGGSKTIYFQKYNWIIVFVKKI